MSDTDFVELWLNGAKKDMALCANRAAKSLELLKTKDTNYHKAHVVMVQAYKDAEAVFAQALADHQNSGEQ